MCLNAKGDGDWGDGISADIDVKSLDKNYPIPRVPWGADYVMQDVALRMALESIGYSFEEATRSAVFENGIIGVATMPQ